MDGVFHIQTVFVAGVRANPRGQTSKTKTNICLQRNIWQLIWFYSVHEGEQEYLAVRRNMLPLSRDMWRWEGLCGSEPQCSNTYMWLVDKWSRAGICGDEQEYLDMSKNMSRWAKIYGDEKHYARWIEKCGSNQEHTTISRTISRQAGICFLTLYYWPIYIRERELEEEVGSDDLTSLPWPIWKLSCDWPVDTKTNMADATRVTKHLKTNAIYCMNKYISNK